MHRPSRFLRGIIFLCLVTWISTAELVQQQQNTTRELSDYSVSIAQHSKSRNGWRTFQVLVAVSTLAKVPDGNQFNAGDFLAGVNEVFNEDQDNEIARVYQTCMLPPPEQGAADFDFFWMCLWTFDFKIAFGSKRTKDSKIMAQGNYYLQSVTLPNEDTNTPDVQYITITGGTGYFRSIRGVIRIKPFNLGATLDNFRFEYTFFFRRKDY